MDTNETSPFDTRNGPDDNILPPVGGGSSCDTTISAAGLPAAFAYPRRAYAAIRENVLGLVGVVAARSLASAKRPAPDATSDSGLEQTGSSPSSPRPGAPVRAAGALRARRGRSKRTLAPTGRNGHARPARPAASGSSGNASCGTWIALTRRALVALACMAPRCGPVDTGVDAGRTALKRAEPGRPERVRVPSLAARAAAVLLVAVGALLALPMTAQAQTVTTFVSNINQTSDDSAQNSLGIAQQFTTGSNSGGFTLSSVDIKTEDTNGDTFSVSVCAVTSLGVPSTTCTALTPPASFPSGTLSFAAPANTVLAENRLS